MEFRFILSGILLVSTMFVILVSISTYSKHEHSSRYFSYFNICIAFYMFGYAMELSSNTLSHMLFWNMVQYLGVPFIPAFWLLFTLEYLNKDFRLITKIGIVLVPIVTFIVRYTNDLHHLYYLTTQVITNQYFSILYLTKGPWYWIQGLYLTVCFMIVNYLYFMMYQKSTGPIKRQSLLMLIASLLPWITFVMDLFNLSLLSLDFGPFALLTSDILFFIAFLRYKFLYLKPLARDQYFKSTRDGIIVVDTNYKIIDFNPSAESICSLRENLIGKDICEVFGQDHKIVISVFKCVETQCEINNSKCHYKVNTVKLAKPNALVGYIVTLTDITKYVDMMEELNYLASHDPLTDVLNRRYFVELGLHEIEKSKRYQCPLSMIIFDVDFFKKINDNYGHQAGDAVLQKIADLCRDSIRTSDILARYGGEEFVIFLPETKMEDCRTIANRILTNIAAAEISYEGRCIKFTVSIGITGVRSVTNESLDAFLKYADRALYQAKADGRNCVRCREFSH